MLRISFILIAFILSCAAPGSHIKSVVDLAPPEKVRVDKSEDELRVTWNPSQHEPESDFLGYNVYYSKKSLILAPIKNLPEPIYVRRRKNETILKDLDENTTYFIHVRSRRRNGDLSLPSLPEIVVVK